MGVAGKYSTASLKKCYRNCFSLCIVTPDSSAILCPMKCFRHCTVSSFPIDFTHRDNVYFCKLGCAMSLCTNISTILFPSIILSLSLSLSLWQITFSYCFNFLFWLCFLILYRKDKWKLVWNHAQIHAPKLNHTIYEGIKVWFMLLYCKWH